MIVDGFEGNDMFFIVSMFENMVVLIVGGLGIDMFNVVGGMVDGVLIIVVGNNLGGHSGFIVYGVESYDVNVKVLFIFDVVVLVGDNEEVGFLVLL